MAIHKAVEQNMGLFQSGGEGGGWGERRAGGGGGGMHPADCSAEWLSYVWLCGELAVHL